LNPPPSEPYSLLIAVFVNGLDATTTLSLIILIILLICSALISGSEVAFFSLSASDLRTLQDHKSPVNERMRHLLKKPSKLLATILICNNLINIAIVILAALTISSVFDFTTFSPPIQFAIEVVAVTALLLLFGEVIPKVYAASNAMSMAGIMTFPLIFLNKIFTPLSFLLVSGTELIVKKIKPKGNNVNVNELEHALELTRDSETTLEEHKILEGIVKFGNIEVRQILRPRTETVAFDIKTDYTTLLKKILESGFSRIPIYKDSFDEVVGTLYIKDLLPYADRSNFKWQTLVRSPFYIPENKKLDDLLKDFQEKKIHMAIVVDEYGGTSGIVTLEDVIEEIVGDIADEFDDDEINYSKLDDNNYIFEGKTLLVDLYRILDIDEDIFEKSKGEADTLAGFILELTGKILKKNERVQFENFTFTIEAADKRRIKQVKITLNNVVEK
jgi:putative hemolysin